MLKWQYRIILSHNQSINEKIELRFSSFVTINDIVLTVRNRRWIMLDISAQSNHNNLLKKWAPYYNRVPLYFIGTSQCIFMLTPLITSGGIKINKKLCLWRFNRIMIRWAGIRRETGSVDIGMMVAVWNVWNWLK